MMKFLSILSLFFLVSFLQLSAKTIYVNAVASGNNDGSTWTNAYISLQSALASAVSGDEVWVCSGTYKPAASGGATSAAFYIASGIKLYGHFAGTETATSQRQLSNSSYATILSGDLNGNSGEFTNMGDNSKNVVVFDHSGSETLLDGFTVTQANYSGIYVDGHQGAASSPTLRNCLITLNTGVFGAGIFLYGLSSSSTCVLSIDNCTFHKNRVIDTGRTGAIEAAYNVQLNITNSFFTNNTGGIAGAIWADGNCQISNTTFSGNINLGETGTISKHGGTLTISDCSFLNNVANIATPGVALFYCTATIIGTTFNGNYSLDPWDTDKGFFDFTPQGGAILNDLGSILTVTDCVFELNHSMGTGEYVQNGGAICNLNSLLKVENCLFKGNFGDKGGAIYSSKLNSHPQHAFVSIKNSAFTGNRTTYYGGAICLEKTNVSGEDPASFFYVTGFDKEITNCTFNGNICGFVGDPDIDPDVGPGPYSSEFPHRGGAIYTDESPQNFKNCIIWDNSAPNGGNEIYYNSGGAPSFYYSDIKGCGGSGSSWTSAIGTDGGNNKDINPGFITPVVPSTAVTNSGNCRIAHTSPCAEAGNNSYMTLTRDLEGNSRIQDALIDMGAYESKSNILYVNSAALGSQNGTSFTNGYLTLQQALNAVASGEQIWVAKGTYKPSSAYTLTDSPRYYHFELKDNVQIYGGFAGTETAIDQRTNFGYGGTNETILSGDIGTVGDYTDNCYHVILNVSTGLTSSSVLNGVTITGGNANGLNPHNRGGGVNQTSSSPTLSQVTFTDNRGNYGGGAFNQNSSPQYVNCLFYQNQGNTSGGGMRNNSATPTVTNCTFTNNTSGSIGGGVDNSSSSAIYNNCVFWGNTATTGKQIYGTGAGTSVLNYSCYANETNDVVTLDVAVLNVSNNNNTSDPLFVNSSNTDFRLYGNSPCVNTGNNTYNAFTSDIREKTRIQNTTIDRGAYEWSSGIDPATLISWTGGALSTNWNTTGNWNPAQVPTATDDVLIPDKTYDPTVNEATATPAVCKDLTIQSGAVLTIAAGKALTVNGSLTNSAGIAGLVIKSDGTGTGSLKILGSASGSATVQRYMLENKWHVVSAPATENINTFLNRNLSIPQIIGGTYGGRLGMMDYDTGENDWNLYFEGGSNGTGNSFVTGKGYMVRTSVSVDSPAPTILDFQGTLNVGNLDVTVNRTGLNGWNCIGNPYTTAIKIADGVSGIGTDNFIDVNYNLLDDVFTGVYIFNGIGYDIVNFITASSTESYASLGQGFFVRAKTDNTKVSFKAVMQAHNPVTYKSALTSYPSIKLMVANNSATVSTEIKFIDGATKGLDKGYDAGIFKADPSFAIFTKLVEPFDAEFQLQCLPTNYYSNLVIPVGIDSKAGGEIVFSVQAVQLGPTCKVILEDKLTNTFTNLSQNSYKAVVAANTAGTGRFYLHTGDIISGLEDQVLPGKLTAYVRGNTEIRLIGEVGYDAVATLVNGLGKVVLTKKLEKGNLNIIGLPNLSSGVYLLNINDKVMSQTIKVMIRKR